MDKIKLANNLALFCFREDVRLAVLPDPGPLVAPLAPTESVSFHFFIMFTFYSKHLILMKI